MLDYVSVRNWVSNQCTRVTAKLATFMLFTDPGETVVETKEHVSHQQTSHATCNHRDTHTLGRGVGYLNFLRLAIPLLAFLWCGILVGGQRSNMCEVGYLEMIHEAPEEVPSISPIAIVSASVMPFDISELRRLAQHL